MRSQDWESRLLKVAFFGDCGLSMNVGQNGTPRASPPGTSMWMLFLHGVTKQDLASGRLPTSRFGANDAWWGIMVLAFNLNSLMKRLVLPEGWAPMQLNAIRFGFINLARRVIYRARQLVSHLSQGHPAYELLTEVRQRLRSLWDTTESVYLATGLP